jgi:predicted NUDIX family NTP pyrophosphohydrolase
VLRELLSDATPVFPALAAVSTRGERAGLCRVDRRMRAAQPYRMPTQGRSAGLLLFRRTTAGLEVFLVHPGGPYSARKDAGAWTIPKGEPEPGEEPLAVAVRELAEETGQSVEVCAPAASPLALGTVRQRGGKTVEAWAVEGDWPAGATLGSNTFEIEWPPRSGRRRTFPEVDRGEFFPLDIARQKINPAQVELLDRLAQHLAASEPRAH